MKKQLFVGFLVVGLCLAVSSAAAGDCKEIFARIGPAIYLGEFDECSYGGEEYLWCIDASVTGNLRGTWHFLSKPAENYWEHSVLPGVLGVPGWDLWVVWGLSVFETHKGDVITQDNAILNHGVYFPVEWGGPLSGMTSIIGGTGRYEGATGWLGYVIAEADGGLLMGVVCTP